MSGNTFGKLFRLTTFGESHGRLVGGVIEGCPSQVNWDEDFIKHQMQRRKAGNTAGSTTRVEDDLPEFVSGIYRGKTTGTPIAFFIANKNQRSEDYNQADKLIRPGHAGYAWEKRFGIFDPRGGGRASARETAARVAGGAVARLFIRQYGIEISAFVRSLGPVTMQETKWYDPDTVDLSPLRCPDRDTERDMMQYLHKIVEEKETVGGIIHCRIRNCPSGLGAPVFDKLQASLAHAMFSIPSVTGFEFGEGFRASQMKGSQYNDTPILEENSIRFPTNHAGGLSGGISTGEEIYFNVAFRPLSSIQQPQPTLTLDGLPAVWEPGGRHDVTALPRAVPVVEAMAALVIADHLLRFFVARNFSHASFR